MKVTVTKTHTCDKNTVNNYTPTSIDSAKAYTNRLVSICGKYYTIVTPEYEIIEIVGKAAFEKWAKANEYVTDF